MKKGGPAMSAQVRERVTHALLSVLLAAGLVFPLLGILLSPADPASVILPLVLTVLFFELASLNRKLAFGTSILAVAALLAWLFAADGTLVLSDTALAVFHRLRGVTSALPLVRSSAVPLITVLVTLVSCFACKRGLAVYLASLLCVSLVLLLYLTGTEEMTPWIIPALAALLIQLCTDRFPETSPLALLPWVAAALAAAFFLAGGGTGETPLTQQADNLRQQVLDRLFFTEPRDVFSLSSEGYYPEGQDRLGGKAEPHDTPVMQVSAPRPVYLRGVILNDYTGRGWRNTAAGRRCLWQSVRFAAQRQALFDQLLPNEAVQNSLCTPATVSVRMLTDSASSLFVPQRIRELTPGGGMIPYFSGSSELFVTRNLQAGDTYSVSAPLFQAGDSGLGTLVGICSELEDPAYEQILETYTALPSHLEHQIYELAREAAAAGSTPYEKALALQSWLSRSYRYTLDVNETPDDMDFVTRFLMISKEGYCTYFASAMTVLCRMVGLPARYVEGYLAEPDDSGRAVVTGLNGHAWTEVYFKGFGWLTFDATPRTRPSDNGGDTPDSPEETTEPPEDTQEPPEDTPEPPEETQEPDLPQDPEPTPEPETPEPSESPASSAEASPEPSGTPSPDADFPPEESPGNFPWLWLLLLIPLLLLLLRILLTSPSFRSRRAENEDGRLDVWAQEIFDLLRAEGLTRRRDESPMAFGRRVDRSALFTVAMGPVGECLSLNRYSAGHATESDTLLVRDSAILLKDELSRPARLKYLIRRIFLPLSRREYSG